MFERKAFNFIMHTQLAAKQLSSTWLLINTLLIVQKKSKSNIHILSSHSLALPSRDLSGNVLKKLRKASFPILPSLHTL